jgi:hypothetical protein
MHQLFRSAILVVGLIVGTNATAEDLLPYPEIETGVYDELFAVIETGAIQMQMGHHSQNYVYNSAMAQQLYTIVLRLRLLETYQIATSPEGAAKIDNLLELSNILDVSRAEYDAEATHNAQSAIQLQSMLMEVDFPPSAYDKLLERVENETPG